MGLEASIQGEMAVVRNDELQFGKINVNHFSWINKKLTMVGWPIDEDRSLSEYGEVLCLKHTKKIMWLVLQ